MFMHICLHLDDLINHWESTNRADFVAQNLFRSWLQYESSEGLMDVLAFLVPKLWPNFQKLIREILTNPLGNS